MEDNKSEKERQKAEQAKRLLARKAVEEMSNPDSLWTITQEIMQEVVATYTVKDHKAIPPINKLIEDLKSEIGIRYEDPEKTILLDSIPNDSKFIKAWFKKDGWDTAVWGKVRIDGLFTSNKRAEVIESIRQRAIDKSDAAAKLWLTLSGDYSEKPEADSKSVDLYREINKVLQGNKDNKE